MTLRTTILDLTTGESIERDMTQDEVSAHEARVAQRPVPQTLPWWKGRAILEQRGHTAALQTFIDAIPNASQRAMVQLAWDGADFVRDSPMVNTALEAIGYSQGDVDQLFIDGDALTL